MSRVPKAKARLKPRRHVELVFNHRAGSRFVAAGLCGLLAVMFLIHQTQVDGAKPLIRGFAAVAAIFFSVLAAYFWRRGARRGPMLRLTPDGFGIAVGFSGWIELPWNAISAFRYWEPTGFMLLVKRRQTRWVGVVLKDRRFIDDLPLDQRFDAWLNRMFNRPSLCVIEPTVDAPILDVLQAFKDHAPRALDDYEWLSR